MDVLVLLLCAKVKDPWSRSARSDNGRKAESDKNMMKRVEVNDPDAIRLVLVYRSCIGMEKDEKKGVYYLEEAAIGGHPNARHNLGDVEWNNGRADRAVKHLIIAAKLGNDDSLEVDGFAAALRGHKAAVDATKSLQREMAFSEKI
eukprot:scaffold21978_cov72-Skeletonema_dohrnii-CCMP3373.AAC.3